MKTKYIISLLFVSLLNFPFFVYAQDQIVNIENGKIIYKKHCAVCHMIDNDRNRIGPSLQNVIHRKAGSLPNFNYSPAMKQAGNDGVIWDNDNLKKFLLGPQAMIKGNRMATIRFAANEDLLNLITYISKISSINMQ